MASANRENEVEIESRDYWFKIVDMLQHNWALLAAKSDGTTTVFFIDDTSGVFDELTFPSGDLAKERLIDNGFSRYAENAEAQSFICAPEGPFKCRNHPNGPIYSSGRFWRS